MFRFRIKLNKTYQQPTNTSDPSSRVGSTNSVGNTTGYVPKTPVARPSDVKLKTVGESINNAFASLTNKSQTTGNLTSSSSNIELSMAKKTTTSGCKTCGGKR